MSKHKRKKLHSLPIYVYKYDLSLRSDHKIPRIFAVNIGRRLYKAIGVDDSSFFTGEVKASVRKGTEPWRPYTASDSVWIRVTDKNMKHIIHRTPRKSWYE